MVEKGGAVRRSRRAASLTAQVLWNFQIEDDKNNHMVAKSGRKISTSKESFQEISQLSSRRGRKRSVFNATMDQDNSEFLATSDFYGKKKKLSAGCSGHIFPLTKPLQVRKDTGSVKKLTASVAPLVKPQPAFTKPINSTSSNPSLTNSTLANPILLLPVSLRANQGSGLGSHPTEVGGLSLVTLQASPDLFNCFGLNKSIIDPNNPQKQWNSSTTSMPANPAVLNRLNSKIRDSVLSNISENHSTINTNFDQPQVEPLNLKMGETTVPCFKNSTSNPKVALVQPLNSSKPLMQNCETIATSSSVRQTTTISEQAKKTNTQTSNRNKLQRRKSRASPVSVSKPNNQLNTLGAGRKRQVKCPSPDYACSSPDVDDVHREPRHSCTRKQIFLRHKAAPAPGTRDYEAFVELQRRLLAEAKRAQRAKSKAKAKIQEKKTTIKRENTYEDRPISAAEPYKHHSPETSNNGWKWTGKPFTSLVFSVDSGKYVPRVCYPGMCRTDKRAGSIDYVLVRDCVFLLAAGEEELSYIAKVTALWEKPNTKEMMISLVWYYRPEHTDDVSKSSTDVSEDELFASRHQDEISVACVEERCYVLTYSEFCRAQANSRQDQMWKKDDLRRIVPSASKSCNRSMLPNETPMNCRDMFYCQHLYDVFQRRVRPKLPYPTSLTH